MTDQEGDIRIYVACLAAYNNGILHGAWIDAAQDADAIRSAISDMLAASPIESAEEYAIHDYEGFEGVSIAEYQHIESVADLAAFIDEYGTLGAALLEDGGDIDEAQTALDTRYVGEFCTVEDFARHITEETTTIPDTLRHYIDYELMARDMECTDITAIETGFEEVHIFWNDQGPGT